MLNGNKGTPSLLYTNHRAYSRRPSADPFAGLKTPKIVHPITYWDTWEEFMQRTMVLRFRPTIQRFGASGRPLRRKKVPETVVELRPVDRPDSHFDIYNLPEDQALLDDQNGVFVSSAVRNISFLFYFQWQNISCFHNTNAVPEAVMDRFESVGKFLFCLVFVRIVS